MEFLVSVIFGRAHLVGTHMGLRQIREKVINLIKTYSIGLRMHDA